MTTIFIKNLKDLISGQLKIKNLCKIPETVMVQYRAIENEN